MILPRDVPHPGEILKNEFIDAGGLTQIALAKKLRWTTTKLNQVVRGKRSITADSALDLSQVFGNSPQFWMNLQAMFDIDVALRSRNKGRQKKKLIAA